MSEPKIPGVSRADMLRASLAVDKMAAKRDAGVKAALLNGTAAAAPVAQTAPNEEPPLLVFIGVPSSDMLHADFAFAMSGLYLQSAKLRIPTLLGNAKSTYVHAGRNILVESAINAGATHLLFLDSDMTFPPEALARLLSHGKDIVGATYVRRRFPHGILGSKIDGSPEVPTKGLVRMAEMPTGCLLIDMECFKLIEPPYFRHEISGDHMVGEDILFCRTMTKLGKEVWCDMDLSMAMGHLGQEKYTIPGTYLKAMEGVPPLQQTMPMPGHKEAVVTPVAP